MPTPRHPRAVAVTVAALAFCASADPGRAQEVPREVLDTAKREGKVIVYGSLESEVMKAIQTAFEGRYGVKVDYWRASSTKVLDRALTEARAGKPLFDVILNTETPIRILKKARRSSSRRSKGGSAPL